MVQGLGLPFPMQRVWIQSLIGELSSHMIPSQEKKTNKLKLKQKQYCSRFSKDFKMVNIKKYF